MQFEYAGDEEGGRIPSWFKMQLKSLTTCIDAGLPEAALTLIYSGIDTFGLLNAPPGVLDATGDTYKQWCEKYILMRLQSVEGDPVMALDLWAARCGSSTHPPRSQNLSAKVRRTKSGISFQATRA